ncbi:hypothetical protein L486_05527 [Kwoniella mangroviensis CBS 10435]|uniref:Transcription initiation factor IIF subunit alpha n=1 Tax=Kwoniella mangroviensis CBS 10435 TaxID=1331196 RepID=A0A1B9IM88_9TREE|nr:hypothetical protein L486_05527 [Kwoniella mangroviensis CBS 10435]
MSDAALFLRKRKDKDRRNRVPSRSVGGPSTSTSTSASGPSPSTRPSNAAASSSTSTTIKPESSDTTNGKNPNITEIKIFSSGSDGGLRFNFMRLNHEKEIDPSQIGRTVLLNRKRPGPKQPPLFALDGEGKIMGKYVYDASGKPVLDAEGKPVVEKKPEGMDMSLIGTAPPGSNEDHPPPPTKGKRKMKKGTKEVLHQDVEVMRLRREEAQPWILENSKPRSSTGANSNIPETWVGRMQEPSALPTVLLINDGTTDGFEMVPLGRTYRFDPERPFKALDSDEAIKLFEHQAKHKIHDRWALRPEGSDTNGNGSTSEGPVLNIKAERDLEQRAMRWEGRMRLNNGNLEDRKPKIEKYEDDYVKEGRRAERGLEGGIDEELDFDEAEHFQDDDDVNTFYRNAEEEDDAKEAEEQQKKEFRLANANVGDKPQIAEDDDEDDLFGERKKYSEEGKQLKKIMKKRREEGEDDNLFSDDDSDDSDTESIDSKTSQNKDQDKDKDKKPLADGDRPSRPPSRGPGSRGTSSPTGKRPNGPMPGKASTAPPGSGAALLAQRAASRGASPRPSGGARAGSPLSGRAASPEGRATSPVMRGNSPVPGRGQSPGPARGSSPVSGHSTRDASPAPGSSGAAKGNKSGKRKTTSESPGPSGPSGPSTSSPSSKRKNSPSEAGRVGKKSKKSGSNTPTPGPEEIESFPGMITKQDVLDWFKGLNKETVPMSEAIAAFRNRIMNAGKNREANQKLFLGWMKMLADQEEKMLRLKDEYR